MNLIVSLLAFVMSVQAFAVTKSVILPSEKKGNVVIQGKDADAQAVYDSLRIAPVTAGKVNKKTYTSADGNFGVFCTETLITSLATTCTFTIMASSDSLISYEDTIIKYSVSGAKAAAISEIFLDSETEYTFLTSDKKFVINAKKDSFDVYFNYNTVLSK